MKKINLIVILLTIFALSCSKNRVCYDCEAGSGGQVYKEKVCTDSDPKQKLPTHDANGAIGWSCKER